jgi:hypothetical protein
LLERVECFPALVGTPRSLSYKEINAFVKENFWQVIALRCNHDILRELVSPYRNGLGVASVTLFLFGNSFASP